MLIRRYLQPGLGGIALRDLRPEQLQHFYNGCRAQGRSARTVRYCHTLLHGALAQAMKNGLVARNVATLVEPPRKDRNEMRTLTLEQLTAHLLPVLAEDRLGAAILLAFTTGLRRGELLALRWQDIDLTAGVLHVRQTVSRVRNHTPTVGEARTRLDIQEPKTASSNRAVPIPAGCLAALKRHKAKQAEERLLLGQRLQDTALVFCRSDGRPCDPSEFTRHFQRMLKRVGLPPIRLHDARHTFATLMLELGESPKTVQTMLGHSSVAITLDIYSHVSLELEKRAASKLNAALMGGQ
jgi:integrase